MKITFDLKKDAANVKKHGVSLRLSCEIDWGNLAAVHDDRVDYGEDRYSGTALIARRLYVVVFTIRDDALRVISLRKATRLEIKRYENEA